MKKEINPLCLSYDYCGRGLKIDEFKIFIFYPIYLALGIAKSIREWLK